MVAIERPGLTTNQTKNERGKKPPFDATNYEELCQRRTNKDQENKKEIEPTICE